MSLHFIEKIPSKEPEFEDYDMETSANWAQDPVSQQSVVDVAANCAQSFEQVCVRQLPVLYLSSEICSHLPPRPLTCVFQVQPPVMMCSGGEREAIGAQDVNQVWSFVCISPLFRFWLKLFHSARRSLICAFRSCFLTPG